VSLLWGAVFNVQPLIGDLFFQYDRLAVVNAIDVWTGFGGDNGDGSNGGGVTW
jgi:hypothetical protein